MTVTAGPDKKRGVVLYRRAGQHAITIEELTTGEAEQLIKDLRHAIDKATPFLPRKFGEK